MAGVSKIRKEMNPHQPVAGFTGVLDTTETSGGLSVRDQIEQTLSYQNQYFGPGTPDEIDPETPGILGLHPLLGEDVDDLNEDTVASTPLNDGFKDPNEVIEEPTETDLDQGGQVDENGNPISHESAEPVNADFEAGVPENNQDNQEENKN